MFQTCKNALVELFPCFVILLNIGKLLGTIYLLGALNLHLACINGPTSHHFGGLYENKFASKLLVAVSNKGDFTNATRVLLKSTYIMLVLT